MSSLRDTIETTFSASAFAERNLKDEAVELLDQPKAGQDKVAAAKAQTKDKRPRPSLKA